MDKWEVKIGSIVHYVAYGTPGGEFPSLVHRAAIVTEIEDKLSAYPEVSLCVLNPTGIFFNHNLPYDASASRGGTWHFPLDDGEPPRGGEQT